MFEGIMVWHNHQKNKNTTEAIIPAWERIMFNISHYTSQCQIYDRNSKPLADWLIPRRGLCGVRTVSLACHRDGAWDSAQLVSWHIFYKTSENAHKWLVKFIHTTGHVHREPLIRASVGVRWKATHLTLESLVHRVDATLSLSSGDISLTIVFELTSLEQ